MSHCPIEREAYQKQYYLNNIEKIKQYKRQHYLNNIEKIKQDRKQYCLNNIEKIKEYHLNNNEKIKAQQKRYSQTDNGKKSSKICDWKHNEIITDDYEFLYEWYNSIDNCLNCGVRLISVPGLSNHKHLDHDHTTGEPCIVVCGDCNVRILK